MLRLSRAGAELVDRWARGEVVESTPATDALRTRLVDAGFLHPVVDPVEPAGRADVGFVLPYFDDASGIAEAVASIRSEWPDAPVVVVDDASPSPCDLADVDLVRRRTNGGPGAARNSGVASLPDRCNFVVFVDSDVTVDPDCVATLVAHFDDDAVVAVAPRIQAALGDDALARFEADHSPLDLGGSRAIVRRGSGVPYVPSTVLAIRRSAFDSVGGFDEAMRVGEDVDLIWRLLDRGDVVRYEAAAGARHRNRPDWASVARQRHAYGTAAAPLDRRHPGDVAPVEVPVPMFVAWTIAWLGGPLGVAAGLSIAATEAKRFHGRLGDDDPERLQTTVSLAAMSQVHTGKWLAHAVRRAWLPVLLPATFMSRRVRRVLMMAFVLPYGWDWWKRRKALGPVRYVAARLIDDLGYSSGLWRSVVAERSVRPLLPRLSRRGVDN